MKNVVKKLFSLLLVGVVAISMFSFVAPPPAEAAEAAEAGSNGTLILNQRGLCKTGFHVTFYDYLKKNLGEYDTGCLKGGNTRKFKIPKNTYNVHVYVAVADGGKKNIDFYADESGVNEKSQIELTSKSLTMNPELGVRVDKGWLDGARTPISRRGTTIKFDNNFKGDRPSMFFIATFYDQYNNGLCKKIIELPYGEVAESEIFETPYGINRIEFGIFERNSIDFREQLRRKPFKPIKPFKLINRAAFELREDKTFSKDNVITITLGDSDGRWKPMEFNYPECWQKIK